METSSVQTAAMPEFDISPELAASAVAAGLLEVAEDTDAKIVYEPTEKGLERLSKWLEEQTIHDCPSCDLPMLASEDYLCPTCRAASS